MDPGRRRSLTRLGLVLASVVVVLGVLGYRDGRCGRRVFADRMINHESDFDFSGSERRALVDAVAGRMDRVRCARTRCANLLSAMSSRRTEQRQIYKIIFMNQGKVCEIYAGGVSHGGMFGFVEVEEILFGEKNQIVVDPSEESLKLEFEGVRRTYIPVHSVIRIDEVEKEGTARITGEVKEGTGNVASFPMPVFTPKGDDRKI